MPNYKRLTFIFFFLSLVLLSSDTNIERQVRKSLLSLFNIVVEESSQVSDSAPGSILEAFESARYGINSFLADSATNVAIKTSESSGILSFALSLATYTLYFFKFVSNYIITFYPFVMFMLYLFFTSSLFKKDEFGYEKF